jgi:hypothetical protein
MCSRPISPRTAQLTTTALFFGIAPNYVKPVTLAADLETIFYLRAVAWALT